MLCRRATLFVRPLTVSMRRATATSAQQPRRRPTIHGVVFDMDGTLTVPNLDFGEMYDRCDVSRSDDILEAIAKKPAAERERAERIIEEMEEEGRRGMELMPGCRNLITYLRDRAVPLALVTRNTQRSVGRLVELLEGTEASSNGDAIFSPAISRDHPPDVKPKPDPSAMMVIASEWKVGTDELLMVGDSPSNDVAFGKAANAFTMLLDTGRRHREEKEKGGGGGGGGRNSADVVVDCLEDAPFLLAAHFTLPPLTEKAKEELKQRIPPLKKYPPPSPSSEGGVAAAGGDVARLKELDASGCLTAGGFEEEDDEHGRNSPLIWAAEMGQEAAVAFLLTLRTTNVNHRGYLGSTALSRACRRGHNGVVEMLLAHPETDPNIPNIKEQYPLHFCAFKEHRECLRTMLRNVRNNNGKDVNTMVLDRKNRSPAEDTCREDMMEAIYAARRGEMEVAEAWLDK